MIFIELTYSTIRSGTNKTFDINPAIIKTMTEYFDEDGKHKSTKLVCGCDQWQIEVDETKDYVKCLIQEARNQMRVTLS
jgi:hypothetical protein